jgi:hypothetical protein
MSPLEEKRRSRRPAWLVPLLCLVLPALAAVAPWVWRRVSGTPQPAPTEVAPLRLTGDARRDRRAILVRAAERLLPPGRAVSFPDGAPPSLAALLGEIGVELLPLDPAQGKRVVEQAIAIAMSQHERVTPAELAAPERSRAGVLVRLAGSLQAYPALAEETLQRGYEMAHENRNPGARIFSLCLFAQEAARIDPVRARAALRQARGAVSLLPDNAPVDPTAAVAAATARVEGNTAARPLVERALQSVPPGRARPLVQARLAASLAAAAPERAAALAQQAANISFAPQRPAVATLLAPAFPEAALQVAEKIDTPGERAATLIDMGVAVEASAPEGGAAFYRRALREVAALPPGPERTRIVVGAATGLAAYDLTAARAAVDALAPAARTVDRLRMAARAAEGEPAVASRMIESLRNGDPAPRGTIEGSFDISLAQVVAEPDFHRALALAQQGRNREFQAAALLCVARRLKTRHSPTVTPEERSAGG